MFKRFFVVSIFSVAALFCSTAGSICALGMDVGKFCHCKELSKKYGVMGGVLPGLYSPQIFPKLYLPNVFGAWLNPGVQALCEDTFYRPSEFRFYSDHRGWVSWPFGPMFGGLIGALGREDLRQKTLNNLIDTQCRLCTVCALGRVFYRWYKNKPINYTSLAFRRAKTAVLGP